MARIFLEKIGQEEETPKEKKDKARKKSEESASAEAEFFRSLSPKLQAGYKSMDESQRELFKYMADVPGADLSKIDLIGKKRQGTSENAEARAEEGSSGSGTGAPIDGFTHRSGTFGASTADGGAWSAPNRAVSSLQSLRQQGANPALAFSLAEGLRRNRAPAKAEPQETVWQHFLRANLSGLENSAASFADASRALYALGQGGRTRDMEDLRESADRQYRLAEQQADYLLDHPEAGDAETARNTADYWKRQVDAYDKVLQEDVQQHAAQETAALADALQTSAREELDRSKEGMGWLGGEMMDVVAAGAQMAGDALLGAPLGPGGGMWPLTLRAFGSGSMDARQGGGTLGQQLLSGGLTAGAEVLTEKLSSAALPFKLVYGEGNPSLGNKLDDLVGLAVRKFAGTPTGQRVLGGTLQGGKAFALEGLEEFVGDWLQWQLPRLYGGDVNRFSDQLASSLQSFFTGGLVGLFGAAMDPGTYGYGKSSDFRGVHDRLNSFGTGLSIGEKSEETVWQKALRNYERRKEVDKPSGNGYTPDSIAVGYSLGAARKSYDILDLMTGAHFDLMDGTHLQNVEVFAGKDAKVPYRKAQNYADAYGGDEGNWQHVKGMGVVDYYGEPRRAELHWSQCEGYGKHDFFIKRWLE